MEGKLCECGCGKPAPIAKKTRKERGHTKGYPVRFISGHNGSGRIKHPVSLEIKLCECGCGKQVGLYNHTCNARGQIKGQPKRFIHTHHSRGMKRSDEIKEKFRKAKWESLNGMWKGDDVDRNVARGRAIRRYALKECELCGKPSCDRHHKDGNTRNNEPTNIQILCRRCHMIVDGRIRKFIRPYGLNTWMIHSKKFISEMERSTLGVQVACRI